jgi:hypothetical protein
MSFLKLFRRASKTQQAPSKPVSTADTKSQLELMLSAAVSIRNFTFSPAARRYLTERYGRGRPLSPQIQWHVEMFLFQESLAFARILKDEKREAEILYYLGSIHQRPPLKSIIFAGPVWSDGKMEIAGGVAPDRLAGELCNLKMEPVPEDLEKALQMNEIRKEIPDFPPDVPPDLP